MERSFLSISCLSHNLPNISSGSIGDIDGGSDGQCEGCAKERRLRRKGEKAKGPGSSSTAVQLETAKGRPWESIWGCSAVKEALSNQFQGKPVQFPGALGLDIPFSSLCTAQI